MIVLGINYYFHDTSACIIRDGKVVAMMEEERLTRHKHTDVFPERAIASCLAIAGAELADVDHVALSIQPTLNARAKCVYWLRHPSQSRPFLRHELVSAIFKQRALKEWIDRAWPRRRPAVHFVPHHVAHAAGSFLVSPFEHAALLSLDGSGEWACSFLGEGRGTAIEQFQESYFPMSLGAVYEAATEFCGFKPNYDEGKTMGLAPYGDPSVFSSKVADLVHVDDEGNLRVDLSYFSYQHWGYQRCAQRFYDTFGPSRRTNEPLQDHHKHVAAAFQHQLEECALALCRVLRRRSTARHLVVAGGVGLNSVMNGRLLREAGFDGLYVMPAAGDNGTAIGAAAYVYHTVLGHPRVACHDDAYLGTAYSDWELERLLHECKLPVRRASDVATETAALLAEGKIVGWFQGRMEIGPRALGNRSILADPTRPGMKDTINAEVKHREAFRPFAPSVPVEGKDCYFDISADSPFMLQVCDVRPQMRTRLAAITHVDGTARLQTVSAATNPLYHSLLRRFAERRGVPVLLNTSFNIQGEPIVEAPRDAIRCFFSTGLDCLVLGSFVLEK